MVSTLPAAGREQAEPAPDSSSPVVSARDVGKMYHIYQQPQDRLKQMLFGRLGRRYGHDFWALRNVSFDLHPGERIGVIGRNGSGKSTLLQIMAGTLAPTEGQVSVRGRVAALLELGSGFNPEFSGRENVFVNGAILGMSRQEIDERFDAIASFAEIGEFIDQPVKLYSSGMFVRLAFAVTTSLRPDVLLVDEALAVGDVFFQQKCYRRMNELRDQGCAVVLVTHSMVDIEQFCDRAVVLDRGRVLFQGTGPQAVKQYYLVEQTERMAGRPMRERREWTSDAGTAPRMPWPAPDAFPDIAPLVQISNGWARCTAVAVCDVELQPCHTFAQQESAHFFFEFEVLRDIEVPIAGVVLQDQRGVLAHGKGTLEYGTPVPNLVMSGQRLRVAQTIRLDLGVGEYTFEIGLAMLHEEDYAQVRQLTHHELSPRILRLCHLPAAGNFTVTFRGAASGTVQLLHHGVADLPGEAKVEIASAPGADPVERSR